MESLLKTLTSFRAVYCSGAYVPNGEAVTALSLLFEEVYLPSNVEFVRAFVAKYRFSLARDPNFIEAIKITSSEGYSDPFADLSAKEQETARHYLSNAIDFAHRNASLFGKVFTSEMFPDNQIAKVKLVKQGNLGELNEYLVTFSN